MALLTVLALGSLSSQAQVDEIKESSEKNARDGRMDNSDNSSGGGSVISDLLLFLPHWQRYKLQNDRNRYPSMVSLDAYLTAGYKPSDTYLLWPRIRANWGLFSSDFRMNYLIEKDDLGGFKHIRTNDWQVIQINIITSRFITFRAGTGVMQEMFGSHQRFSETSFMFGIHAPDQSEMFFVEYRFSKDWDTGVNPRNEFSAQYHHQIFQTGILHGYVTAGAVYQNYYGTTEFWGVQAGLVVRIF